MIPMRFFREHPHFADLFAQVHVICWPILWWQLNVMLRWCHRRGVSEALYSVNEWGFVTVTHHGLKPDPRAYAPPVRTFRPLTDEGWDSDRPACLGTLLSFEHVIAVGHSPFLQSRSGALTSPHNTS